MLSVSQILKNGQKMLTDNSPAILTAIGVTGTVSTAILAARGGMHALRRLDIRNEETRDVEFSKRERFIDDVKTTWRCYVPAVSTGVATIVCILGANHISSKRSAALITAYSLSERAFSEYKDKVIEQFGANKERKVRDEIAQDRVTKNPPSSSEIIIAGNGDVLCLELLTGRYFQSNMEALRKAQNDINSTILVDMSASLNEFWRLIGLPPTGMGEELGFNLDCMVDLQFSAVLSEDGRPCIGVGYAKLPRADFHKIV